MRPYGARLPPGTPSRRRFCSSDAIDLGLDAALPAVIELESKIGEFGRGERI